MTEFEYREAMGKYCVKCKAFLPSDNIYCPRCQGELCIADAIVYHAQGWYTMEVDDIVRYLMLKEQMLGSKGGYVGRQGDSIEYGEAKRAWLQGYHEAMAEALRKALVEMQAWKWKNDEPQRPKKE